MDNSLKQEVKIEEIIVDPPIDREYFRVKNGRWKYTQTNMEETPASYPVTAGATMTFGLPAGVFNLAASYLEFQLQVDAQGGGTFQWTYGACIPFFRSISFGPGESSKTFQIDQYHHFSKMALPYVTSQVELNELDNTNIFFPSRTLASQNKLPANNFEASVPFTEVQHAIQLSGGVANQASTYLVKIPLKLFVGTPLCCDQTLYWESGATIMFTLEDPNNLFWSSTDKNEPNTGVAAITGNTVFKNPRIQLAKEDNDMIDRECREQYKLGRIVYVDGCAKISQQQLNGTSQNINQFKFTNQIGEYVKRVYAAPFNGTENKNTYLDNCNQAASPITTNATNRVITFQTQLDGKSAYDQFINASPFVQGIATASVANQGEDGDFARMWQYYRGSCITTSGTLGLNFSIIDDFTSHEDRTAKNLDRDHRIEGLSLETAHSWQISSTNSGGPYQWYVFAHTQMKMVMKSGYGVKIN